MCIYFKLFIVVVAPVIIMCVVGGDESYTLIYIKLWYYNILKNFIYFGGIITESKC